MAQKTLEDLELKVAPLAETNEEKLSKLMAKFLLLESHYTTRNQAVDARRAFFEGNHWVEGASDTAEGEFRLVINYCRRVVLDFAGTLARAPVPRVPIPPAEEEADTAVQRARKREKLVNMVWPDFLTAWRRVELNAAKCSYGVLEVLWDDKAEPENGMYKEAPFVFRSIKVEDFYPVYRTYDTPDDFLYVYRKDEGRLKTDIEFKYGVELAGTHTTLTGTEMTVDLVEYWDDKVYALIARTIEIVYEEAPEGAGLIRKGLALARKTFTEPGRISHYAILEAGEHGYGRIPFFVLQNLEDTDEDPTDGGSIADVDDISVLNQHLNLMRSEQAEEIVTNIHRPVAYKSDDHMQSPRDLSFTAGAVYPIGLEEELEPLAWTPQPVLVENHIAAIDKNIRDLSFLGEAGFGSFAAGTSGVAARIALTPMQRLMELKLPPRLYVLRAVGSFLLRCFEEKMPADTKLQNWILTQGTKYALAEIEAKDIAGDYFVDMVYGNMLPRDDMMHKQNELYTYLSGGQSLETTHENMGMEDPQAEMKRMEKEAKNPYINPEKYLATQRAILEHKQMLAEAEARQKGPPQIPTTPTQPTQPGTPGAAFPRGQQEGGFGAGSVTPFLQRPDQQVPLQPQGPGINVGGGG